MQSQGKKNEDYNQGYLATIKYGYQNTTAVDYE